MFALALAVSEILNVMFVYLKKIGQGQVIHFSHWYHSMANDKIYKRLPYNSALALTISDIKIKTILPSKSRSRSCSRVFGMTLFDGNWKNLQKTTT